MARGRRAKERAKSAGRKARSSLSKATKKTKHHMHKLKNVNIKKEATRAGLGALVGLGIKYGAGFLASMTGNQQAMELTRRAANVAAAYAGNGTGELAYQVGDAVLNRVVMMSGGMAMGTGPGEAA
jgi:hypothetical protein